MNNIHPTAVIAEGARISASAQIGPFCTIESGVTIGENVRLVSHVSIGGKTRIGDGTTIFPFASLGHPPQDLKYHGEQSELIIGAHNTIREHVTMNPGTSGGGMVTRVGDHCLFMVGAHVAHDCIVGNHCILANNATLAGHVQLGDNVIIGGLAALHQFVRVGSHAIIGGLSGVEHDVIPYASVMGERARLAGLNLVGLKRRQFDRETISALKDAFTTLFESDAGGVLEQRQEWVAQRHKNNEAVAELLEFMKGRSKRGMLTPKQAA